MIIFSTDFIFSKTSTGKFKYWVGLVEEDSGEYYSSTRYFQFKDKLTITSIEEAEKLSLEHGFKITSSGKTKVLGKNIGKSNETTPKNQAISEIVSDFKKQLDKGYQFTTSDYNQNTEEYCLPMLAKSYKDYSHNIDWSSGVAVQAKYDGVRCLYNGSKFWSRKGKPFIDECVDHLHFDTEGFIIDGELILPPEFPLQDTVSAIKKFNNNSKSLIYRVYDIVAPELTFEERFYLLENTILKDLDNKNIILCPTTFTTDEEEMYKLHLQHIDEGWEGTMVRTSNGKYSIGQRSSGLLKVKDFLEDEFELVDVEEGEGKFSGCAILVLKTSTDLSFKSVPVGTMEYRSEIFNNKHDYIGTFWTVRYQNLTPDGIPFHSRAICQRLPSIQG